MHVPTSIEVVVTEVLFPESALIVPVCSQITELLADGLNTSKYRLLKAVLYSSTTPLDDIDEPFIDVALTVAAEIAATIVAELKVPVVAPIVEALKLLVIDAEAPNIAPPERLPSEVIVVACRSELTIKSPGIDTS